MEGPRSSVFTETVQRLSGRSIECVTRFRRAQEHSVSTGIAGPVTTFVPDFVRASVNRCRLPPSESQYDPWEVGARKNRAKSLHRHRRSGASLQAIEQSLFQTAELVNVLKRPADVGESVAVAASKRPSTSRLHSSRPGSLRCLFRSEDTRDRRFCATQFQSHGDVTGSLLMPFDRMHLHAVTCLGGNTDVWHRRWPVSRPSCYNGATFV